MRRLAGERQGFSLVELSVVVAIMAILATMGLEVMASFVSRTAYMNTQDGLKTADTAVQQFFDVYGRLPCPADRTLGPFNTSYGKEDCSSTRLTPATDVGGGVLAGALPFRTLNLPMSSSIDGFGDKFNYFVTYNLTQKGSTTTNTFGYSGGAANVDGLGGIEIRSGQLASYTLLADPSWSSTDDSGSGGTHSVGYSSFYISTAPGAAYAIFSNGADQRGAYGRNGAIQAACLPEPVAEYNTRPDSQNCISTGGSGSSIGPAWNVLYDSRFNNGTVYDNYYDDVIVWHTKDAL